ncbi:MAG: hypothetical protein FWB80_00160 [Defluviitaleaceae bacterium]|nr:hypothetical protein [Defluviitaleaceae bacterium]
MIKTINRADIKPKSDATIPMYKNNTPTPIPLYLNFFGNIKFEKPEFEVTIGSAYFCVIDEKDNNTILYEDTVLEVPVIKTQGLSRIQSELDVYASGESYYYTNRTAGANITLGAVALPSTLLTKLEGAETTGGFELSKTSDLNREFAYGYWSENNDGSFVFFWHPVCKLTPTEDNRVTRTQDTPEPEKSFAIRVIPYNRLWKVKYETKSAIAANYTPLAKIDFFNQPLYTKAQMTELQDAKNNQPPSNSDD